MHLFPEHELLAKINSSENREAAQALENNLTYDHFAKNVPLVHCSFHGTTSDNAHEGIKEKQQG